MTSYPALRELAEKARPYSSISDEMRAFRFEAPPEAILSLLDKYDAALAEIERLRKPDLALIEATARKLNPGRSEDHIKSVALDALTIFRALTSETPA